MRFDKEYNNIKNKELSTLSLRRILFSHNADAILEIRAQESRGLFLEQITSYEAEKAGSIVEIELEELKVAIHANKLEFVEKLLKLKM